MSITLGDLKEFVNNIESEFDNCFINVSFDDDFIGILNSKGEIIDEIKVHHND